VVPVPQIGNSLREARIRRGLSIKDVEDVTKIRSKYLEALEEDDFEVVPGSTFVKGFLRSYAVFLKLDADALVEEYRVGFEARKEEPGVLRTEMAQKPRSRTSTERRKSRVRRTQRSYALIGAVAVVVVILLAWFGSGRGQDAATLDASAISTPSSSTNSSTTLGSGGSTTTTRSESVSGATVTTKASGNGAGDGVSTMTGENVQLVISVTEGSCWLVIKEDDENGAEVYAGTLSAGGEQTFDGSKRYWMMVGKPEVLSLLLNGASYSLEAPAGSFVVTETGIERSR